MAENENDKGSLVDSMLDPKGLKESGKFQVGLASVKMAMLMFFSFMGVSVAFGLDGLAQLADPTYWVQFAILMFEQNYAYDAGYQLALALLKKNRADYRKVINDCDDLVEGVVDEVSQKVIVEAIKVDAPLAHDAIDAINVDGKKEWFQKQCDAGIENLNKKINVIKDRRMPWKIFFRKWVVKARLATIAHLEGKIVRIRSIRDDKETLKSLQNRTVKGYQMVEYGDIVSDQAERSARHHSKYAQKNQKAYERKGFLKRNGSRVITALLGCVMIYQFATSRDQFGSRMAYTLFIMAMQFSSGWSAAVKTMEAIIIYNANERLACLFDVKHRISAMKKNAAEEQKKQEAALAALLTSWIEAEAFDKQFNIDREKKRIEAEAKAKLEAQAKPTAVASPMPGNALSPGDKAKVEAEQMLAKEKEAVEARMKLSVNSASI